MNSYPKNNITYSSILHTDTLQESQISVTNQYRHNGKIKNFLEALKFVNENKSNKNFNNKVNTDNNILFTITNQVNTTTEGLNVSEYSMANAHFSREEHVNYNIK